MITLFRDSRSTRHGQYWFKNVGVGKYQVRVREKVFAQEALYVAAVNEEEAKAEDKSCLGRKVVSLRIFVVV